MKKLAAVFVIAVLGPALVLAWLATRSLRDQEIVVQSQQALLQQAATDALASDLNTYLDDVRVFFNRLVDQLVEEQGADALTREFDSLLPATWEQAAFACVVTDDGRILSPAANPADPRAQRFLMENADFLTGKDTAQVYQATKPLSGWIQVEEVPADAPGKKEKALPRLSSVRLQTAEASVAETESDKAPAPKAETAAAPAAPEPTLYKQNVVVAEEKLRSLPASRRNANEPAAVASGGFRQDIPAPVAAAPESPARAGATLADLQDADRDEPRTREPAEPKNRVVRPFSQTGQIDAQFSEITRMPGNDLALNPNTSGWSALRAAVGDIRAIIGDAPEGAISRFLADGLHVLVWRRHAAAPGRVFWVELDLSQLKKNLSRIVDLAAAPGAEACLALLDADGEPVARTVAEFATDWRRPFVASEVGPVLPHWEVAAYLIDPAAAGRNARAARLTLWLLVPFLLVAIGFGSLLIFHDIGREMLLARQKTDFVGNVSHELKTPLTSIRMFSELLSGGEPVEPEKRAQYSGIISREAARLTRLINNLLDFSRLERGDKPHRRDPLDAVALTRETVENYRHQIEADGFSIDLRDLAGNGGLPVTGDRDALAQVLLNLISNAEKYGGDTRAIEVEIGRADGGEAGSPPRAEIRVLDRGGGVGRKEAARIFEKFYRADDSLSSGIQGSGLGLTLARQIARAHGGDVIHRPREGGGSCFALVLPVTDVSLT